MGTNLELFFPKNKNTGGHSKVVIENVTPINIQKRSNEGFSIKIIEKEVLKFLRNKKERDSKETEKRIIATNREKEINNHVFRAPEAEFQNALLRIIHQYNIPLINIESWIKKILAENEKGNSLGTQSQINNILRGVESCNEAVNFLEKEMKSEHKDENTWIATNDQFDARYKVDLLTAVEGEDGFIKVLNLVQVKSSINEEKIENITKTHQGYLDALPQLIGILNKKEAAKLAEKETGSEIIDIDRNTEKTKQLTLLESVLDEYIKTKNPEDANANDFYQSFKNKGGVLNPFVFKTMLQSLIEKNKNSKDKSDNKNEKIEKHLKETVDEIKPTNEESFAFHRQHHVHTIANSGKIVSVVMLGGEKISEIELKHPYNNQ